MTNVNKTQLGSHLDVVKTFVKSWVDFVQLDKEHFAYSNCEFVDKLSYAFCLHGSDYTTSINMQAATMTIYDMSMNRVFKFAIKLPFDGREYTLEWEHLYAV